MALHTTCHKVNIKYNVGLKPVIIVPYYAGTFVKFMVKFGKMFEICAMRIINSPLPNKISSLKIETLSNIISYPNSYYSCHFQLIFK